ncbi:MAG: peptide chain release factor N(5)-glutamine methyltransferase [Muribaculaceae bacterium]|nr:peptide chain release factor N(5)-glutamine methyltransferase [Muribaculaceae bacterium]
MRLSELKKDIENRLTPAVGNKEAEAVTRIILEDTLGINRVNIALYPDREVTDDTVMSVNRMTDRVIQGEPLQYILGYADFHGLRLKVDSSVLIPRPETSALVDLVVDTLAHAKDKRLLDVGTGSGAIAIALARELPFADITAVDISSDALTVAKSNAHQNGVEKYINFKYCDILNDPLPGDDYDAVVSNPPYVAEHEKTGMDNRVLDYEPHTALFVPDKDPLLFYREIAQKAFDKLKTGGYIFFEINPLYHKQLEQLISSLGYTDITVSRDFCGRTRFLQASKT